MRQCRAVMSHSMKSNPSPYTKKTHLITGSPHARISLDLSSRGRANKTKQTRRSRQAEMAQTGLQQIFNKVQVTQDLKFSNIG